jgi:hypothetical protein
MYAGQWEQINQDKDVSDQASKTRTSLSNEDCKLADVSTGELPRKIHRRLRRDILYLHQLILCNSAARHDLILCIMRRPRLLNRLPKEKFMDEDFSISDQEKKDSFWQLWQRKKSEACHDSRYTTDLYELLLNPDAPHRRKNQTTPYRDWTSSYAKKSAPRANLLIDDIGIHSYRRRRTSVWVTPLQFCLTTETIFVDFFHVRLHLRSSTARLRPHRPRTHRPGLRLLRR